MVHFQMHHFKLMHLCGAMSLWHTDVSVYLSVYLCIHPQQENKGFFFEYALMDFCDTWTQ